MKTKMIDRKSLNMRCIQILQQSYNFESREILWQHVSEMIFYYFGNNLTLICILFTWYRTVRLVMQRIAVFIIDSHIISGKNITFAYNFLAYSCSGIHYFAKWHLRPPSCFEPFLNSVKNFQWNQRTLIMLAYIRSRMIFISIYNTAVYIYE